MPVLLIGLGAIFLINNAMPELSVWHLLADWWPLLLIAFGVIRLIEVLAIYGTGRGGPTAYRPMGFGWIIAIVVFGLALSIPRHLNPHWNWSPIRAGGVELFGEQFDYPISMDTEMGHAKRLVLDNIRGGITVTGANQSSIHLEGHKQIRAFDRNSANTFNDQSKVTFTPEGDALFVRTSAPPENNHSTVAMDIQITVPEGMSVEARGRSGDLAVTNIQGAVDVSSQRGEVRLQDIGGSAKLDVDRCDLVRASHVTGTVDVQGNGRDIQVDNIAGQVTINGRFSGTLEFHDLTKPLHLASDQTDLRVDKLPGNITLDLSELRGTNVGGPMRFVTHERDVHLDDFSGPLNIELGHGDVELKPVEGQLARIDVRSRHGNIEMALPAKGNFDLQATTGQGDVSNDYGESIVSQNGEGRANTLRSANPSGPTIALNTDRGEISVRKIE